MPDVDEHEADAPTSKTSDEPEVSWGPTFGPETEADAARPDRDRDVAWHPPGGPW